MVDSHSMWSDTDLQLVGARFRISFYESYHESSNFAECRYFRKFKWPYFATACCYSHMVGYAGSTTSTVYVDMTLIWSKVNVKVTGLLNFRQLAKPCMLAAMTAAPLAGLAGLLVNMSLKISRYEHKSAVHTITEKQVHQWRTDTCSRMV